MFGSLLTTITIRRVIVEVINGCGSNSLGAIVRVIVAVAISVEGNCSGNCLCNCCLCLPFAQGVLPARRWAEPDHASDFFAIAIAGRC